MADAGAPDPRAPDPRAPDPVEPDPPRTRRSALVRFLQLLVMAILGLAAGYLVSYFVLTNL